MARITYRKVKRCASDNETWLQPYVGYVVKEVKYLNGKIGLWLDGRYCGDVSGDFTSEYNWWDYTTSKLLGKPLAQKSAQRKS
ncbi:MAG: hypothetical protein IMZ70_00420 [Candidatus Atribacteria bacterium]|nr:hypothetical protein [Candidatus Atribacteria bacterium]MBE3139011.1 hypothetical protein [Thermoplasmata archaeon]